MIDREDSHQALRERCDDVLMLAGAVLHDDHLDLPTAVLLREHTVERRHERLRFRILHRDDDGCIHGALGRWANRDHGRAMEYLLEIGVLVALAVPNIRA